MQERSELEAEQAHVDRAYRALEQAQARTVRLRSMVEVGRGGTNQARVEAEAIEDAIRERNRSLEVGDAALVFGRIDTDEDSFHIGRVAVSDPDHTPLVVDWRAPVAEPFYRATGRQPLGLTRRRHFVSRGRQLLALEDELFGEAVGDDRIRGEGALLAALEESRSGHLGDIVGTIQAEQDVIIRAPLPGILVVQGGPGTGKTVVALHRAAYLLYTHRFPLEGQGVLVLGPNRLFLRYISRVLPSLGEAGAELAVLADLVADHVPPGTGGAVDPPATALLKGDVRMVRVIKAALADRQRALRHDLEIGIGVTTLRLRRQHSAEIVAQARRRFRHHNPAREFVEHEVAAALAASTRRVELSPDELRRRLRSNRELRAALEWMWPVLTPGELLHDLFGSRALVRSASRRTLDDEEWPLLVRPRASSVGEVVWTDADLPLLDEAHRLLGHRPGQSPDDARVRTYGHIVVDEAQDLTPMAVRMIARRSLNGSLTLVGDIAQATSPGAVAGWDELIELLRPRRPARRAELTLGYRIPGPIMDLAARVLSRAEPDLAPPRSVRERGDEPVVRRVEDLAAGVVEAVRGERERVGEGSIALIVPAPMVSSVEAALVEAGIEHVLAGPGARVDHPLVLVTPRLVKGLEVDAAVVVEPAALLESAPRGLRSLYVALTRPTKRLVIIHQRELPAVL